MGVPLIEEFLAGNSKAIRDIANNEAVLIGFLTLAKGIDDLPNMNLRFYEESQSLYRVTSSGHSIDDLTVIMSSFFGTPAKAPGKSLPVALRFDPTVKALGGIRKEQVLFLKKLKTGTFFGALWPWQRDPKKIEVHLGYCSSIISDADYRALGDLFKKFLSRKKIETMSEVGGQIHGISLPSFLQMSEMEEATYSLKVTSGSLIGRLFLNGGSLVAAQYEDLTGNAAAYRIISWDNAAIQIEAAEPDRVREIHDPLMHVMMESLKIKDEAESQAPIPPPDGQVPPPDPASELPADRSRSKPRLQPLAAPVEPTSAPGPAPSIESIESVPFEKATDRSVGRQDQMSRTAKLLIVLGLVIVFALSVSGGGRLLKKNQVNRRYDRLLAELSGTQALDARIVLLMQYLNAHPKDNHRSKLEARLNNAYAELEKQDYEKTVSAVNRLPVDEKYEKKALSLYAAFSTRYPQSAYAEKIDDAMGDIRRVLATACFEDLKHMTDGDLPERYAAYNDYLVRFPRGAEREAVHGMIAALAKEYGEAIQKQAAACDAGRNWNDCIAQCDRFLSVFTSGSLMETVNVQRSAFQDKQDLVELTAEASLAADDVDRAKRIYTDYLEKRPETTQKAEIAARIDELNDRLAGRAAWNKTKAYASNSANDIFDRIQRLDDYMTHHDAGAYIVPARNLRQQLEPDLQSALRARREAAVRRQTLMRQQVEQARQAKQAQRIRELRAQVNRQLQPLAGRFEDRGDGTVTDRVTGLEWCLLDSRLDLGKCLSYTQAKAYVRQLDTGGHADWQIPTAGELAAIYKNSPFFPGSGAPWYWTSQSFARGFHRVVDVVTSVQETVFTRLSKNEQDCGAVRAVRR